MHHAFKPIKNRLNTVKYKLLTTLDLNELNPRLSILTSFTPIFQTGKYLLWDEPGNKPVDVPNPADCIPLPEREAAVQEDSQ